MLHCPPRQCLRQFCRYVVDTHCFLHQDGGPSLQRDGHRKRRHPVPRQLCRFCKSFPDAQLLQRLCSDLFVLVCFCCMQKWLPRPPLSIVCEVLSSSHINLSVQVAACFSPCSVSAVQELHYVVSCVASSCLQGSIQLATQSSCQRYRHPLQTTGSLVADRLCGRIAGISCVDISPLYPCSRRICSSPICRIRPRLPMTSASTLSGRSSPLCPPTFAACRNLCYGLHWPGVRNSLRAQVDQNRATCSPGLRLADAVHAGSSIWLDCPGSFFPFAETRVGSSCQRPLSKYVRYVGQPHHVPVRPVRC